ncbi:expressed unknown protein [Seminavis robusta]|uniref:Uncharacterized protein n=1 Tax=Seminavis robusta TaxID=568900 RepID=A0A9N8DHX4_9STRA|nr:expressed unknown protein [Seminavis robusta]|eukprot:Sro136_g064100.1 n/a (356) ;mRNA; f:56339-57406
MICHRHRHHQSPSTAVLAIVFGFVVTREVDAFMGQSSTSLLNVVSGSSPLPWCLVTTSSSHSRRQSITRTTTTSDQEDNDNDDGVLDAHEFDPVPSFLNGSQTGQNNTDNNTNNTSAFTDQTNNNQSDPLIAMANLTDKLAMFTRQFEYQLSLAHDDRGALDRRLEESLQDRQKLQSLLTQLRNDKEAVHKQLEYTKLRHRRERNHTRLAHEAALNQTKHQYITQLQQCQLELNQTKHLYSTESQQHQKEAKRLQKQASRDRKRLDMEQERVLALQHTVDEQEHYIHRTSTSTRHLLWQLGKLLVRRFERLVVYIFPWVVRLIRSIYHLLFFWKDQDEPEDEVLSQEQPVSEEAS